MLVDLSWRYKNCEIHVFPHQAHAIDEKRLDAFKLNVNINFTVMEPIHSTEPTLLEILCEGLGLHGLIAHSRDRWHTLKSNIKASQFFYLCCDLCGRGASMERHQGPKHVESNCRDPSR